MFSFSIIPACPSYEKTLILLCFQKYRYLTSSFDRPEFQRMLEDIKNKKEEVIHMNENKTNINCLIGNYATYFEKNHKIRVK